MAARFRPRELRQDATPDELRRQLNDYFRDIAADLGAITARPRITEVQLGDYTARFGEIVRMAPPAAGARLILPAPNAAQPNGRVTLLLVGKSGAVTVEAVSSTINGADTLALGAGEGLVEFTLAPDADGWLAASSDVLLAPAASTSIVYDVASHEYQRAALIGAVTAAQNSNATAFGAAAAKSVLVNAGNASAVPAFLAGTGAFQYLRVNSANTGLEWAVLSLASFPAQASDTFLGNVSGSSGVPSAVNLSSLAGTDLTFSAHALSVSSTWSSVLGRGATSGAHNPIVDASQWLGFGSSPGSVSTGQIRADGDWTAHSNGVASLSGDGGASLISSGGDINLLTLFGDIKLTTVLGGRVAIPSGFLDYTGQSASTPSVASGHGLVWTKTDSPSRLYFTDDGNTDNKLAYVSDITGIANSQLANVASDTFKGNVSGSSGAPSDVNLSSLAGAGLNFGSHAFFLGATGSANGYLSKTEYTSTSTWSTSADIPNGDWFIILLDGPGGGAGSGAQSGTQATTATGGGGGGGGARKQWIVTRAQLVAMLPIVFTLPAGGAGGAARVLNTNTAQAGNAGSAASGDATISANGVVVLLACRGGGGAAGSVSASGVAGGGGGGWQSAGSTISAQTGGNGGAPVGGTGASGNGAASAFGGAAGGGSGGNGGASVWGGGGGAGLQASAAGFTGGFSTFGGSGGGGGGSVNSNGSSFNATTNGGAGGGNENNTGGGTADTTGVGGGNGADATELHAGMGGGGGKAVSATTNTTVTAFAGGNGGAGGGGGGGGGAAGNAGTATKTSGKGGDGGSAKATILAMP